jgi:hypothetical protein
VSQVAIHHPSSYGFSGQVGFPASVTGGTVATFSFQSLLPGAHTITWAGGAPATSAMTVAGNGTGSATHTYPAGPGTYKMYVTEDATGRRVAQRTIVLPYAGGVSFGPSGTSVSNGDGESAAPTSEPPPPEIPVGFDPGAHTVNEVEDYVTAQPDERDAVLAAEQAGRDRVTLVSWLESFSTGA